MQVEVTYGEDRVVFEVPGDRLTLAWAPHARPRPGTIREAVLRAIESPRCFPPLRQAVVPGDRAVLALGPGVEAASDVIGAVVSTLETAGVDPESVTVLMTRSEGPLALPAGVRQVIHDPENAQELAYLSTTASGKRIYLNRALTDADFVLPIGSIAPDATLGFSGPWSALYPTFGDVPARSDAGPDAALAESSEVAWLLGSPFHLGVVEGSGEIVAGQDVAVREEGIREANARWTAEVADRSELVVAGLGAPGRPVGWADFSAGLAAAISAVRRGGKVALLSHLSESLPSDLRALADDDGPDRESGANRAAKSPGASSLASQVARALDWADIYLLSEVDEAEVEPTGLIPLSRPEEVRRLIATAYSCALFSRAEAVKVSLVAEATESST